MMSTTPNNAATRLAVALAAALLTLGACKSSGTQQTESETAQKQQEQQDRHEEQQKQQPHKHDDGSSTADKPKHANQHKHGPRGHHFEQPERYAERWNDPERDAWQKPERVIAMLGLQPGMTVADLGTGTGYFLAHLSEAVGPEGTVYGLDISDNMVEYTRKRVKEKGLKNVKVRKVSPSDPGVDGVTYDRLLTVNTWHHVRDRVAYAKRVRELLADDGAMLVVDYTMQTDQGPPQKMKLTPEEVVRELDDAGFEAEIITDEKLPKQYVVKGTKK